jgi:adenylate cyclase
MAISPKRERRRRKFHWTTFLLGLAVTAGFFALFVRYPGLLQTLELKTSDARMMARPAPPLSDHIVIVAIDDKSIAELGHWPWSRAVLADLEKAFIDYKVKVVGYDILFSEPDPADREREAIADRLRSSNLSPQQLASILGSNNDQRFADRIREHGNTFLAYGFDVHGIGTLPAVSHPGYMSEMIKPWPLAYSQVHRDPGATTDLMSANAYAPPIPALNSAARKVAFADAESDSDGLYRLELTVVRFNDRLCVPLFLAVAWAFEDYPPLQLNIAPFGISSAQLGNLKIPVDEIGRMLVVYHGPAGTFPRYSAADVIAHRIAPDKFAGRIALVGVTGKGLGDRAVTPAGFEFPRVEIHANAVEDVLTGDFVDRTKTYTLVMERAWAAALGLGVSIATAWFGAAWSVIAMVLMAGGYFGFAQYMLIQRNVMLGVVLPFIVTGGTVVILLGYRYVTEGLEKGRLRHAFEHYLHPDVIATVVDDPGGLRLGGERRRLAILFADIVGFTSRAEKSDPVELVAMLNVYMTRMTNIILESGGVVDKLMGDGIMAFWGAPNVLDNPSRSAIDAALRMLSALGELRREDGRFHDLEIGIGIATGEAIVGNFGGERRFDYSVIGDTVNFASRLEGLTRKFGVRLLVSRATFNEAAGAYVARDIGLVRVKGKAELVPIVEIAGRSNDGIDPTFYDQFAQTIDLLKKGDTLAACNRLEEMRVARPNDEVVSLYLEKLRNSGETRDGEMVFEFESK